MGLNYWEMLHLAHTAEAGGGGGRGRLFGPGTRDADPQREKMMYQYPDPH
jgi:hypothetical protein